MRDDGEDEIVGELGPNSGIGPVGVKSSVRGGLSVRWHTDVVLMWRREGHSMRVQGFYPGVVGSGNGDRFDGPG